MIDPDPSFGPQPSTPSWLNSPDADRPSNRSSPVVRLQEAGNESPANSGTLHSVLYIIEHAGVRFFRACRMVSRARKFLVIDDVPWKPGGGPDVLHKINLRRNRNFWRPIGKGQFFVARACRKRSNCAGCIKPTSSLSSTLGSWRENVINPIFQMGGTVKLCQVLRIPTNRHSASSLPDRRHIRAGKLAVCAGLSIASIPVSAKSGTPMSCAAWN
jgi:hypothetical protein